MSRFNSRMNKLFLKTHLYISASDFRIMRNYFRAQLDEAMVNPNDFLAECDELEKLHNAAFRDKKAGKQKADEYFHRLKELTNQNRWINVSFFYFQLEEDVKFTPAGAFFSKWDSKGIPPLVKQARDYFRRKRNGVNSPPS